MAYEHDSKSGDTSDEAVHKEALADFKLCQDAEQHNRETALDDLRFCRLDEQWHQEDIEKRKQEGRPCMTINKMTAFIRQVVNDGRQNKPAIKVHPADDQADPQTADVINGLIRNIEYSSKSDIAYDTGLDFAVSMGFGYWGVDIEYSHNDSFQKDIVIIRKPNPFAIYGDYEATCADSSEWMRAFEVDTMDCAEFEKKYKGKEKIDWDSDAYKGMPDEWRDGKRILVAKYWRRREVTKTLCLLSDDRAVLRDWLDEDVPDMEMTNEALLASAGITVEDERETSSYEVKQYVMNGVEILETQDWAGQYIPIIPIYGEELNVEGKRYFRSLIHSAKDAQRNFNYWRTTCTELVALAPKAPFIGPVGSFTTDADKWATANTQSHPHLEYDVVEVKGTIQPGPQRQAFAGIPAGALQEALNASDDMKAVIGIYDASLGARSNETSGRAINARKQESDTGTFHFLDNQARSIRHTGVVVLDLIPHVYNKARVIRVMGIDKKAQNVPINQKLQQQGQPLAEGGQEQMYDLTIGKYDLTVDTGPGFQTRREEAAYGMTELMRALPATAPVIGPHLAKAQDWPDSEKIAEELAALSPAGMQANPQFQQAQQQVQKLGQELQQAQQQLQALTQDRAIEQQKVEIDMINAETARIKAMGDMQPKDQGAEQAQLPEADKINLEGQWKAELEQMKIDAARELELIRQRGAAAAANADPMVGHDDELNPADSQLSLALQEMMGRMDGLQQIMSAPRRKTLVRGPDGRASHAVEEIEMPQQSGESEA